MKFLSIHSVHKHFPGVQALSDISLELDAGKVHALVGENGAGKSTLLKILSGVYRPDRGWVEIEGERREFLTPNDAIAAGVAIIYQELHLVPDLSVAENLLLGRLPTKRGVIRKKAMEAEASRLLCMFEENISPWERLGKLPISQRQMIEIAKALARNARIIAFDEPTSSLTEKETKKLFSVIRELKSQGKCVIYVSHRLQEIFEVCDTVTVFRDGKLIQTWEDIGKTNTDEIVNRMVGRSIRDIYRYTPRPAGEPALEVENVMGPGLSSPLRFSVAKGEVVGLFGLIGAGRTELLKLIYGATRLRSGTIKVCGVPCVVRSPRMALRKGIAFCPEDRKKEGIIGIRSVLENINISSARILSPFGILNMVREVKNAQGFVDKLSIKTPTLSQRAENLSGGNQQKVILARLLSEHVKVLLFDEPTRGIDVGAKSEVYSIIMDLAARGFGILLVSSDLPEILGISDRILVMREGSITASLSRAEATEEGIMKRALPSSDTGDRPTACADPDRN